MCTATPCTLSPACSCRGWACIAVPADTPVPPPPLLSAAAAMGHSGRCWRRCRCLSSLSSSCYPSLGSAMCWPCCLKVRKGQGGAPTHPQLCIHTQFQTECCPHAPHCMVAPNQPACCSPAATPFPAPAPTLLSHRPRAAGASTGPPGWCPVPCGHLLRQHGWPGGLPAQIPGAHPVC